MDDRKHLAILFFCFSFIISHQDAHPPTAIQTKSLLCCYFQDNDGNVYCLFVPLPKPSTIRRNGIVKRKCQDSTTVEDINVGPVSGIAPHSNDAIEPASNAKPYYSPSANIGKSSATLGVMLSTNYPRGGNNDQFEAVGETKNGAHGNPRISGLSGRNHNTQLLHKMTETLLRAATFHCIVWFLLNSFLFPEHLFALITKQFQRVVVQCHVVLVLVGNDRPRRAPTLGHGVLVLVGRRRV